MGSLFQYHTRPLRQITRVLKRNEDAGLVPASYTCRTIRLALESRLAGSASTLAEAIAEIVGVPRDKIGIGRSRRFGHAAVVATESAAVHARVIKILGNRKSQIAAQEGLRHVHEDPRIIPIRVTCRAGKAGAMRPVTFPPKADARFAHFVLDGGGII